MESAEPNSRPGSVPPSYARDTMISRRQMIARVSIRNRTAPWFTTSFPTRVIASAVTARGSSLPLPACFVGGCVSHRTG